MFCIPTACFPSKWRQLSCLTFSPCHIDWPSLMPVAWANVVPFCCVKNVALYCKQQFCSCPVVLSLTAASNTLSWLQQFLCPRMDGSLLQAVNSASAPNTSSDTLAQPASSAQSKLLFSPFVLPSWMSETSKGQFSIFLEPVCWNLYPSDVTKSILWEPRAELP